jgi:hypothetical protein
MKDVTESFWESLAEPSEDRREVVVGWRIKSSQEQNQLAARAWALYSLLHLHADASELKRSLH